MCFKVSSANLRPFCLGLNVLNYALFTSLPEIRYHCLGFRLTLQWCHNGRDGVSNHRRLESILNRLFRRKSKKTSKFRVTGFCEGNSPVTSEFPARRAGNSEKNTIWWRHHGAVLSIYHAWHRCQYLAICLSELYWLRTHDNTFSAN